MMLACIFGFTGRHTGCVVVGFGVGAVCFHVVDVVGTLTVSFAVVAFGALGVVVFANLGVAAMLVKFVGNVAFNAKD